MALDVEELQFGQAQLIRQLISKKQAEISVWAEGGRSGTESEL